MHHRLRVVLPVAVALACSLQAQRVLREVHGTRPGVSLGVVTRSAGDLNGDGVNDLLVSEWPVGNSGVAPRLDVVSGATGATLYTIPNLGFDATGIADVNFDGRRDFVASATSTGAAQVFSGATGQPLFTAGGNGPSVWTLADVGDVNGDGRGDFVALANPAGLFTVVLFSGNGGAVLGQIPGLFFGGGFLPKVRPLQDVNGDGRTDVIVANGTAAIYVITTSPLQVASTLQQPGRLGEAIATADIDGDGHDDVLARATFDLPGFGSGTAVRAFSATTGAVLRTYAPLPSDDQGWSIGRIGDLDADGADDFATVTVTTANVSGSLLIYSGRGPLLGRFDGDINNVMFQQGGTDFSSYIDGLGDVDGDGFGDFAAGFRSAQDGQLGGYRVISGKLLADVRSVGGACGYGPFPVQLGCTRPILGLTAQVVCRDGPSGVLATLAMSLQPTVPRYLGASTCSAAVGPEWFGVFTANAPTWTFAVAVPPAPDLAGLQVALQAFYGPTNGPLGIDLSNGLWARLGY